MLKLFYFLMVMPILVCSQVSTIESFFSLANNIIIYKDNQIIELNKEEKNQFEDLFFVAFENAQQSPAFCVCMKENVQEEIKQGYWVKFVYADKQIRNEMPYDELLIHIEKNISGVNVLRGNDGIFEGRCYYFDLENNLDDVYEFIENLSPNSLTNIEVELESQEINTTFLEKDEDSENDDDTEEHNHK